MELARECETGVADGDVDERDLAAIDHCAVLSGYGDVMGMRADVADDEGDVAGRVEHHAGGHETVVVGGDRERHARLVDRGRDVGGGDAVVVGWGRGRLVVAGAGCRREQGDDREERGRNSNDSES